MDDICNFLPPSSGKRDIEYYHFVYEAELEKLTQPFLRQTFSMHLAFKGSAVFRTARGQHQIQPGTLFFTFPGQPYEITDSENFTYLYITFAGDGAQTLLNQFGIHEDRAVFRNFGHLTDFWMTSIRRASPTNIQVLTESVLLHTLSFIEKSGEKPTVHISREFDAILQYISNNYTDPEMSIAKAADIFGFSKKYFSALFVKNTHTTFTDYLAKIRVEHAVEMLKHSKLPVAELAEKCGYSDPLYFSKVFKHITGVSPSKYNCAESTE